MSYILDALKRADAERERGAVPGLHAQQNAALAAPAPARSRLRLWLISGAVLMLSAVTAGLWLWRGPSSDTSLASVQLALITSVANSPNAVPLASPAPVPIPAPAPVAPLTPTPVPVAAAAPVTTAPVAVIPVIAATTRTSASKPDIPTPATGAQTAVAAPAAAPPVPLLSELPEDVRRLIPTLTITGAVYSETPGQRLLLVNNLVLNQGGLLAPELSVEEIRPKSAVFNFRGTRFRLAH